jgi:hypothetical protein
VAAVAVDSAGSTPSDFSRAMEACDAVPVSVAVSPVADVPVVEFPAAVPVADVPVVEVPLAEVPAPARELLRLSSHHTTATITTMTTSQISQSIPSP